VFTNVGLFDAIESANRCEAADAADDEDEDDTLQLFKPSTPRERASYSVRA
jgi:hypothetical protein